MAIIRQPLTVLLGVALALGVGGACFSERTGPAIDPGLANCRIPLSVIDSGHVVIAINNFTFVRDSVLVPAGTTVTWINCEPEGTEPHTTTSDATTWDSPDLSPGARFSHRFTAGGVFPYHCKPHPFMTGKVVVQ